MSLDSTKVSLPKAAKVADNVKIVNREDGAYVVYSDGDGFKEQKITPGNLNKEEIKIIKRDGEVVTEKLPANLAKGGFPDLSGDGEVTQKDILMGKGVIKMKKGGIVKNKSSRTRIAKRGFGIAKRGY